MPRNSMETPKADRRGPRNPTYRRHRASGQTIVTLNNRDFYLGPYGTKASRDEYDRLIGEWLQNKRQPAVSPDDPLTITQLVARFLNHAKTYYANPDGSHGREAKHFESILKPVVAMYGNRPAGKFGPIALKTVRQQMIDAGKSRKFINVSMNRVRYVFRWAGSEQLVSARVCERLKLVEGLRAGKTAAKERPPISPVADETVQKSLPHLTPTVRAMVQLQMLTGARPGEIIGMRTCDIDTTGGLWVFKPSTHKNAHRGHSREIFIGPKGQAVLGPFLKKDLQAFIFTPQQAVAEQLDARHENRTRKTSNRRGVKRVRRAKRAPTERYDTSSYRQAIEYGCRRAFPPPAELTERIESIKTESRRKRFGRSHWMRELQETGLMAEWLEWTRAHRWHPHQLRHTAATNIRKQFGVEGAQALLGHQTLAATQIYAERNMETARGIAAKIG